MVKFYNPAAISFKNTHSVNMYFLKLFKLMILWVNTLSQKETGDLCVMKTMIIKHPPTLPFI